MPTIYCPAKINTVLQLLSKRSDGYHNLYTHLIPINLYDQMDFKLLSAGGINFKLLNINLNIPLQENLVYKTAKLFEFNLSKKLGIKQTINIEISLTKNIPHGAGLGGGSSDVGATLNVLNHLYQNHFTLDELKAMATEIGMDCSFFIMPTPSIGTSRGELLQPIKDHPLIYIVLVKPDFSISTAQAFSDIKTNPDQLSIKPFNTIENVAEHLQNDFENQLFKTFPKLKEIKNSLIKSGALNACLSGSGSAMFGVFKSQEKSLRALKKLKQQKLGQLFACKSIESHQFI